MLKAIKTMNMSLDDLYSTPPEQLGEQLTQLRRKNKTKNEAPLAHLPKLESAQINLNGNKDPVIKTVTYTQPLPNIRGQVSPKLVHSCGLQSAELYPRPVDSYFPETMRGKTDSLFQNASPRDESSFFPRIFFNQSPGTLDSILYTPQNTTPFSSYRPTYGYGCYNLMPFKGTFALICRFSIQSFSSSSLLWLSFASTNGFFCYS